MHDPDTQIEYRSNMLKIDNKKMGKEILEKIQEELLQINNWIKAN